MTLITMSAKELDRFQIIKKLIDKHLNGTEASHLLTLSVRQVKRLKAGRTSNHRLPAKEQERIKMLLHERYADFKPTFASEKLRENHHLDHDPKTICQIMINEGLWQPKRKEKISVHRAWRQRRSCYGEMIQFDGSYEHWLENRGGTGELCLLAAIDDATGKIVAARFAEHEGVFPVFGFWQEYIVKNGKPRSIYLDKFSTYNVNHKLAK
ncbi:MAG: Riorf46 protein, partial [Parcubacteria group bacterium GW2011_GWC2_45_15]